MYAAGLQHQAAPEATGIFNKPESSQSTTLIPTAITTTTLLAKDEINAIGTLISSFTSNNIIVYTLWGAYTHPHGKLRDCVSVHISVLLILPDLSLFATEFIR